MELLEMPTYSKLSNIRKKPNYGRIKYNLLISTTVNKLNQLFIKILPNNYELGLQRKIAVDIPICFMYTLKLLKPHCIVFIVLFCDKRFAVISMKPYKIRSLTMKNVVMCLVRIFAEIFAKSPMLKWANQGGGGNL
jgi:hypothetical protein